MESEVHMQDFRFRYAVNDTYMAVGYKGDEAHVIVPDTYYGKPVSILYDNLFEGHSEISSVTLPGTLTDIGGFVFDGCASLQEITLPDGISTLWQYAFVRSSLTRIVLPQALKSLYPYTFKDARELETVICPKQLLSISATAFQGCAKLRELHLSRGTSIAPGIFADCPQLEIIYID